MTAQVCLVQRRILYQSFSKHNLPRPGVIDRCGQIQDLLLKKRRLILIFKTVYFTELGKQYKTLKAQADRLTKSLVDQTNNTSTLLKKCTNLYKQETSKNKMHKQETSKNSFESLQATIMAFEGSCLYTFLYTDNTLKTEILENAYSYYNLQ